MFFLLSSPSSAEEQPQCGTTHWASKTYVAVVHSLRCVWLLQLYGLHHTRLPCDSLLPRVCSNSCPLSWWCHPTVSPSVIPFYHLQSFPASGSFQMRQLFTTVGQSIGTSASVLTMNIQGWFPLGLTGLISLQSKGLSKVFSSIIIWKYKFFGMQLSLWSDSNTHTWLLEKPYLRLYGPLLEKWCFCFLICCLGLRAT